MNDFVEIMEYWNKADNLYEVMLWTEWEKKQRGEPYEVLRSDTSPPWIEISDEAKKADWLGLRTPISQEEFKDKFSPSLP